MDAPCGPRGHPAIQHAVAPCFPSGQGRLAAAEGPAHPLCNFYTQSVPPHARTRAAHPQATTHCQLRIHDTKSVVSNHQWPLTSAPQHPSGLRGRPGHGQPGEWGRPHNCTPGRAPAPAWPGTTAAPDYVGVSVAGVPELRQHTTAASLLDSIIIKWPKAKQSTPHARLRTLLPLWTCPGLRVHAAGQEQRR